MTVDRLTWPTLSRRPSEWTSRLWALSQTWTSPFSHSAQTLELPGASWWCKVSYDKIRESDRREMEVFLAQMRGMAGRVLLPLLQAEVQRGVATGTPVVAGAGQLGRSLATSGWTHATAQILRRGDYFSVATASGPEIKILTADAASDSAGLATLAFEPPLRSAPANGAALTLASPVCVMGFVDDNQGDMALSTLRYGSFTLEFVERWL